MQTSLLTGNAGVDLRPFACSLSVDGRDEAASNRTTRRTAPTMTAKRRVLAFFAVFTAAYLLGAYVGTPAYLDALAPSAEIASSADGSSGDSYAAGDLIAASVTDPRLYVSSEGTFTRDFAVDPSDLLYPAVDSDDELRKFITDLGWVSADELNDGVLDVEATALDVSENVVRFGVMHGRIRHVFHSYKIRAQSGVAADCGVLIIPGSGNNQAFAILNGEGYHGDIASRMSKICDTFILIKPNHGIRSLDFNMV